MVFLVGRKRAVVTCVSSRQRLGTTRCCIQTAKSKGYDCSLQQQRGTGTDYTSLFSFFRRNRWGETNKGVSTSFAGLRRRCSSQSVPTSQGLSSTVGGTCRARGGHLSWCLTQRREAGRGPRPRPEWSRPRAPGAVLLIVVSEPHVERGLCAG